MCEIESEKRGLTTLDSGRVREKRRAREWEWASYGSQQCVNIPPTMHERWRFNDEQRLGMAGGGLSSFASLGREPRCRLLRGTGDGAGPKGKGLLLRERGVAITAEGADVCLVVFFIPRDRGRRERPVLVLGPDLVALPTTNESEQAKAHF